MDAAIQTAVSLISSVGFPIVCVIFLWQFVNSTMKDFTKTMQENTELLKRVCERIDKI